MNRRSFLIGTAALGAVRAQAAPAPDEVKPALDRAIRFYVEKVTAHGGYVWRTSGDLQLREGEGKAGPDTIWVQPPGTPTVGEAFLDAYDATGKKDYLEAARAAGEALIQGQLHSGGWYYRIEFAPEQRKEFAYRVAPGRGAPRFGDEPGSPGGWELWKQRRNPGNLSMLDDDTTQAALRFLMRLDRAVRPTDPRLHDCVEYGLGALLKIQYPTGAFTHNYDRLTTRNPDIAYYPIRNASYPEQWSRTWTKDFQGCYYLNDEISLDAMATLLQAHTAYGKPEYREAALRVGEFLLRAQMPDPQPAWAQEYDRNMQPVWDRKFEPPAISGYESQSVLESLLLLYERTGDRKYLQPVPKALDYLRNSVLPDGKLARFYELQTNRPLYFTLKYELTYDRAQMPKHYGFVVPSRLDEITRRYERLVKEGPASRPAEPTRMQLDASVREAIAALDSRGAWVERTGLDAHDVTPPSGVISSATFAKNVGLLSRYLRAQE